MGTICNYYTSIFQPDSIDEEHVGLAYDVNTTLTCYLYPPIPPIHTPSHLDQDSHESANVLLTASSSAGGQGGRSVEVKSLDINKVGDGGEGL
jgi:hypothetical protein